MHFLEEKLSAGDDTSLHIYRWVPKQAHSAILISHGWSEHAGRYDQLAKWFAEQGYEVHAYDHRGHGKSDGVRGHVRRWRDYADDMETVRKTISVGPQYLLGHSMGGMISLLHMLHYPDTFLACALSGPASDVSYDVPRAKVWLSRALSQVWPTLSFSGDVDPDIVCGKQDVVEAYRHDPLNHGKVTARWFSEYLQTIQQVKEACAHFKTPVAIWHGEEDELVAPWVGEELAKRLSKNEKQFKVLPGLLHEILYEESWPEIAEDIRGWFSRFPSH